MLDDPLDIEELVKNAKPAGEIFPRQSDLHKIAELSEKLVIPPEEGKDNGEELTVAYRLALKTLYWQAGENMGHLQDEIRQGVTDGKRFTMLLSYGWSIIESLEDIMNKAHLGDESSKTVGHGKKKRIESTWILLCNSHSIRKDLFNTEDPTNTKYSDWNYVRFLRSFISVHPLNTNYGQVIEGFLPHERTCCQYVDYIVDEPWYKYNPEKYYNSDYRVALLYDTGGDWPESLFIKSSEVWEFIFARYNALIDKMLSRLVEIVGE